jgi:uncharacterized protein YecT (DUF1311 family)
MARRRLHRALIAALALAAPATAQAQSEADRCIQPARQTADRIAACLEGVQVAADAQLNRSYRMALAALPPADQGQLRDAQRAWLQFRELDRRSLFGGWRAGRSTFARIATARADILAIEAREQQLRVYLPDAAR